MQGPCVYTSSIPSVRTLQTTKTMSLYRILQLLWPIHVSSIRSIFNPESYEFPVYLLPLSVDVSSQGFSLTHTHTKIAIVNTRQSSPARSCCKSKAEAMQVTSCSQCPACALHTCCLTEVYTVELRDQQPNLAQRQSSLLLKVLLPGNSAAWH